MASADKIVFMDRDGVINAFPGDGYYVDEVRKFRFLPGAKEAIRSLTETGHTIFVVSNQAGVGRGMMSARMLKSIDGKMSKDLAAAGGKIRKSFYCTHKPDAGCDCRKPGIGLIKQALRLVRKTLAHGPRTFFVGDTDRDIETGHKVGCTTIFVLSGRDSRRDMLKWNVKPDHTVKDLKAAAAIIQNENPSHPRHRRGRA